MKHEHDSGKATRLAFRARVMVTALWLGGCGPAAMIGPEPNEPGTGREELGAAEHRAAAKVQAERLEQHKELYDPRAKQSIRRCDLDEKAQYPVAPICWVETVNPTAVHLKEVEEHRMRAVQHRKAARDLQDIESRVCAGIADEDRDMSPFSHREDIKGVSPLEAPVEGKKHEQRLVGATIVFRAVPRLTTNELQRIVDCHLARNAAIGHDTAAAEMAHCPLTERGAQAKVRALKNGFAVDVRADDPIVASAIWRRAQALASF